MITERVSGDITDPSNTADIVLGMNPELRELTTFDQTILGDTVPNGLKRLGSVLTFEYRDDRLVHMLICHNLCVNGWRAAHQYVRIGLDILSVTFPERDFSIVQIGAGDVGKKYGANPKKIELGMGESYLPVTLYTFDNKPRVPVEKLPIKFLQGHNLLPVSK